MHRVSLLPTRASQDCGLKIIGSGGFMKLALVFLLAQPAFADWITTASTSIFVNGIVKSCIDPQNCGQIFQDANMLGLLACEIFRRIPWLFAGDSAPLRSRLVIAA